MSIKLMSAIFETEFFDLPLPNDEGMAKASSLKLVLLALADHANDEGESSYPSLSRLERKTALSRKGLISVISSLKYNGIILVDEERSKLDTNIYTFNLACFPRLNGEEDGILLVKSLHQQGSHFTSTGEATTPELVKPLHPNHPVTTNQPSKKNASKNTTRAPRSQSDEIFDYKWPAGIADYGSAFELLPQLLDPDAQPWTPISKGEYVLWMNGAANGRAKGFVHFRKAGITVEEMQQAYVDMRRQKLTVKNPNSLYTFAFEIHRKNQANGHHGDADALKKKQAERRAEFENSEPLET